MITAIFIEHLPATLPRPSSDTVTSGVWDQESNLDLNNTVSNPSITRTIWGLSWSMPLTNSCYFVHSKLTVIRIRSIIKTYSKMLRDAKGNEVLHQQLHLHFFFHQGRCFFPSRRTFPTHNPEYNIYLCLETPFSKNRPQRVLPVPFQHCKIDNFMITRALQNPKIHYNKRISSMYYQNNFTNKTIG